MKLLIVSVLVVAATASYNAGTTFNDATNTQSNYASDSGNFPLPVPAAAPALTPVLLSAPQTAFFNTPSSSGWIYPRRHHIHRRGHRRGHRFPSFYPKHHGFPGYFPTAPVYPNTGYQSGYPSATQNTGYGAASSDNYGYPAPSYQHVAALPAAEAAHELLFPKRRHHKRSHKGSRRGSHSHSHSSSSSSEE